MRPAVIHVCQCPDCLQPGPHTDKKIHRLFNLFLSRLDEDHRRWSVALEALKQGHGGDRLLSRITGLNVETIRRGRQELATALQGFPAERIRRRGGGRPPAKKKIPPSSPLC
jgi:hypothetical protein